MKVPKVLSLALSFAFCLTLVACAPKQTTEYVPDQVKSIINDAQWYEVLWMRWTVTDWVLTLLAAGTAITAAVKNAFSTHNQAQAQAAAAAVGGPAPVQTSGKVDKWVMVFAALTIIATTLDSKMHASQQAERYRMGDLLLQDGIMDYRLSKRTDVDQDNLLAVWHQAQKILEGGAPTVAAKQDSNKKPETAPPTPPENHIPMSNGTKANSPTPKPPK